MIRSFDGKTPRLDPRAWVHDSAEVIGAVSLGARASVWPYAVLRGDVDAIRVGPETNIQDLAVVHSREGRPVRIGPRVTIGHQATIHGARIGEGCLVGMGAVVMEADIGAWSLIGAGAVVLAAMRVPPRRLVVGSPARVMRPLTAKELSDLRRSARGYVALAQAHARASKAVFQR